MGYKMVFSDMDGTLLWKGVRVSVENSAAIRKAVDKGVEFVICTGRGVFGVEKHLQELHLLGKKGYVICQNGAAVYDLRDMHLVLKRSFSPSVVIYALSDFLIMILSWLVKQSLRAFCFRRYSHEK